MTAFPNPAYDGQVYILGTRSWTYSLDQDAWRLNKNGPTGPQGPQGETGPAGVLLTSLTVDTFTGDGITISFPLSITPVSIYNMIVNVDGLVQTANVNFTLSSNNIVFTDAPIENSTIDVLHFLTGSAITGPVGYTGATGPHGGPPGPTGPTGFTGPGVTGPTGPNTGINYGNTNVASYLSNSVSIGNLSITNTTSTTSTITGALVVAGGVGVGENLFVGGNLSVSGNVTVNGMYGITMPDRPAFRVIGVTGNNWTSGSTLSGSDISVDYNQGNFYNNTTGIFTAPIAGLYHIFFQARVGNTNGLSQAAVYKNGNIVETWWEIITNNQSAQHFGVSTVSKLAVGDTLQATVVTGSIQFDTNDNWGIAYIG